jgi:hypothetical protein
MDDPVGALIGIVLTGFGVLVLYGAYKNRRLFGKEGIIPMALSTGSLIGLEKAPEAFPTMEWGAPDAIDKLASALANKDRQGTWVIPLTVQEAVVKIGTTDLTLAERITEEINKMDSHSTQQSLTPLAQLLQIADAKGHKNDADAIRKYVRELTGVSI